MEEMSACIGIGVTEKVLGFFFAVRGTASLGIITERMGPRKDYVMKGQ
jgi:hypothetical protein